jgi:tRNA (guanine26-N2/guanine27-N2)-dimethyltransferase
VGSAARTAENQPKKLSAGIAIMSKTNAQGLVSNGNVEKPADDAQEAQKPETEAQEAQTNGENVENREAVVEKQSSYSYLDTDFYVNLDEKLGKDPDRGKYVRYQLAPRENWGPMSRAK